MPRDAQTRVSRRRVLAQLLTGAGAALLAGCEAASRTQWFPKMLGVGEHLTRGAQQLADLASIDGAGIRRSRSVAAISQQRHLEPEKRRVPGARAQRRSPTGRCRSTGSLTSPATLTLAQLRAMPSRTQITRHDCVEGWSAIGKWTGVPLSEVLARVSAAQPARATSVFHCADPMSSGDAVLREHRHGGCVPSADDPRLRDSTTRCCRSRTARRCACASSASWATRWRSTSCASSSSRASRIVGRGKGGYWEDRGYEWFAGI